MKFDELSKQLKSLKADDKFIGEVAKMLQPPARFGAVAVSLADSDAVYPGRGNDGGKSTKVVEFSLDLPHVGLKVAGTMYARYKTTPDGWEITAEASMPRGVRYLDSADKDAILAHFENTIIAWPNYGAAMVAAEARLTGTKPKREQPQAERPRLVYKPKPTTEAASA